MLSKLGNIRRRCEHVARGCVADTGSSLPVQAVLCVLFASAVLTGAGWALLCRPDLPPAALERNYGDSASRFIEAGSVRFRYRDEGEGDPIVLLHGLTANLFVRDAWAQRLSEHLRVIRLDLPGHGLTGPDPEERYGWPQVAGLVVRLLDRSRQLRRGGA